MIEGERTPHPDPTVLTTAQLDRALSGLKELIETRLQSNEKSVEAVKNTAVTQREHDLLDDKVESVSATFSRELEKAEVNRKESLDRAALTIQTGLDKAERTLQVSLEKAERNLQVGLEAAEKRVNEKLAMQKELMDKSDIVLNQITSERALYITRDQLDLIRQTITGDIKPLEKRQVWTSGRDSGIWLVITVLLAVIGLVIGKMWR